MRYSMRCDVLLRPASESSGRSSIRLCLLATNSSSYVAHFLFMRNSKRVPDRCMYVTVLCSRSADGWRGARSSFIVLFVRARGGGEESRKPLGVGVGVVVDEEGGSRREEAGFMYRIRSEAWRRLLETRRTWTTAMFCL